MSPPSAHALTATDLIKQPVNLEVYERLAGIAEKDDAPAVVLAFWKYLLLCFESPRPSTDYIEPDVPSRLNPIRHAISRVAEALGAEATQDGAGNLIIRRVGRGSGVDKPWFCLQGHLDMVVSQNEGANHNFETDPIEVRFSCDDGQTDGWLKPLKATTLGADNGVGLAAALAMLEVCENHPPLELLFTANEETSFSGAEGLKPGTLKAASLLNLDSEEDYTVIIGSAGLFEHQYKLPVHRETAMPSDMSSVSVKIAGLHGGHSGGDIHKYYCNANKLIARLFLIVFKEYPQACLMELAGGSGPTAIAREVSCVVLVPADTVERFCDDLSDYFGKVKDEYKATDPNMTLTMGLCSNALPTIPNEGPAATPSREPPATPPRPGATRDADLAVPPPPSPPTGVSFARRIRTDSMISMGSAPRRRSRTDSTFMSKWDCSRCEKCIAKKIASGADLGVAERNMQAVRRPELGPLTPASTRTLLKFCINAPDGVLRMSSERPGQTESSINLGVIMLKADHLFCHLCARSSNLSFLESYVESLSGYGALAGASNTENLCFGPPWEPCEKSELLSLLKRTHAELNDGKEPRVSVCHGGLEPGVLMITHPGLDCCSIGPDVQNPHSPDERVNIASAQRFVTWLQLVLEKLASDP